MVSRGRTSQHDHRSPCAAGTRFHVVKVVRACEHLSKCGQLMLFSVFGVSFFVSGQIFFVCNIIEFSILFSMFLHAVLSLP